MKKKILAAMITASAAVTALAQGTIIFGKLGQCGQCLRQSGGAYNYAAAGSYTVALLWASGNSVGLPQSAFTQIAIYGLATGEITHDGYFIDTNVVTTGTATAPGTVAVFEVQGVIGNYTSYAAAAPPGAQIARTVGRVSQCHWNSGSSTRPPFTTPGIWRRLGRQSHPRRS